MCTVCKLTLEKKATSELQDQTVSILPSRFVNTGLIGQGGMGSVFRAMDKVLEREVAIKLLAVDSQMDDSAQQRFLQEAKALAILEHNNIVKILGSGLTGSGNPFHILELLEGESLSTEIQENGPLDARKFFDVISQVCAGLNHAHKHGIVHRDLKPSNIFLSRDVENRTVVKIIDFGIARFGSGNDEGSQNLTRTNTLLGSPAYMSPEQCRASKEIGPISDIYSLGCIMYEALTSKPVFSSDSPMELMYKHMHEAPPKLFEKATNDDLQRLSRLIERCLAKSPDDRPQSASEISGELEQIFEKNPDLRGLKIGARKRKSKAAPLTIGIVSGLILLGLLSSFALGLFKPKAIEVAAHHQRIHPEQQQRIQELAAGIRNLNYSLESASGNQRTALLQDLVKNYCELAELKIKSGNRIAADKTLEIALQKCSGDTAPEKLFRAKIYTEAGRLHNSDKSDGDFQKALALIHDATGSMCSAEEFPLRKEMLTYHLNERMWEKCKSDFEAVKTIWKANPDNPQLDFDTQKTFVSYTLGALHGKQRFVDEADRRGAIEFTTLVNHFLVEKRMFHEALSALRTCLEHTKGFRISSPEFKELAPPIYQDLIFVEKEKGLLSDARRHEDEYKRYFEERK